MRLPAMVSRLLDFCFPSNCAACAQFLEGSTPLCAKCLQELDDLTHAPSCSLCGRPAATHAAPCAYCRGAGIAHFERVCRLGVFEDPLKHLVHQVKYHGRWPLAEFLADQLLQTERAKGLLTETQILVPVPLHSRRLNSRGFNQADVIARRLGKQCCIPTVDALRRTRDTETQTSFHSHEARRRNVKDAFAARRAARAITDKHVVVVDDVMTTGATLNAVAQVLHQFHPASLCALTLAVADPKGRAFEVI